MSTKKSNDSQVDIGAEVDHLANLEADYKKKNDAAKEAKEALDAQKQRVTDILNAYGQEGAKGSKKSVTIYTEDVYKITDYDRLWQFIKRGNHPQLLQRRISNPAAKELIQHRKGKEIPGVEPVEIQRLSVHTR